MSFCERCGRQLGPDEKCNCQEGQAQGTIWGQAAQTQPPTPHKKNTAVIIGAAAAAIALLLIILIIIAIASAGGGKTRDRDSRESNSKASSESSADSYETPINDLIKLINEQSTDVFAYLELCTAPMLMDYEKAVYKLTKKNEEVKEGFEDNQKELAEFFADYKGFKITKCDFVKAEQMKSRDLRELLNTLEVDDYAERVEEYENLDNGDYEDLADQLDLSVSDAKKLVKEKMNYYKALSKMKITDGYEVTVRFYGKYQGEEDKTEKIEDIRIVKVNGTWCLGDAYKLFRGFRFTDELSDVNLYELYNFMTDLSSLLIL